MVGWFMFVSAQALVKNHGTMGVRGGVRPGLLPLGHLFFRLFQPMAEQLPVFYNFLALPSSVSIIPRQSCTKSLWIWCSVFAADAAQTEHQSSFSTTFECTPRQDS